MALSLRQLTEGENKNVYCHNPHSVYRDVVSNV